MRVARSSAIDLRVPLMARTPSLFEPLSLGGLTLATDCVRGQYSAENGAANVWHLQHVG